MQLAFPLSNRKRVCEMTTRNPAILRLLRARAGPPADEPPAPPGYARLCPGRGYNNICSRAPPGE